MHSEFSLLEIGFELFLFGLFVYKIYDLSLAYLIPNLRQKLAEEKNTQNEVLEKEKLLISTHRRLENQITQQERMFIVLEKKVQIWQEAEQKKFASLRRDEASRLELLKIKRIKQQENSTNAKIAQLVVKDAVNAARKNFKQRFNQTDGKQHLCSLVKELFPSDTSIHHE